MGQPLTYDLRLPDAVQAAALRTLDAAKDAINQTVRDLWPRLNEFASGREGPAYKQIEALVAEPHTPHGKRQGRGELETAGRILRAQATRKALFTLVAPILHQGMIRPATETQKQPGKNRAQMRADLEAIKATTEDGANYTALLNLLEQSLNYYLEHEEFPTIYEQMQRVPELSVGLMTFAADDGPTEGKTYRMHLDRMKQTVTLAFRHPDEAGEWERDWKSSPVVLPLPAHVMERLATGTLLAPTLREVRHEDSGERYAVLDLIVAAATPVPDEWTQAKRILAFDWGVRTLLTISIVEQGEEADHSRQISRPFFLDTGGFDGRQARNRQQTDRLRSCIDTLTAQRDALPSTDPKRMAYETRITAYVQERHRCWNRYSQRNRHLAHVAANLLVLLASVFDCSLIAGESLKTLKSTGRGRGAKGRWVNWRTTSQIRGELWRVLLYKCSLAGIHLQAVLPRGTSHTCPRCGHAAHTYAAPDRLDKAIDWGHWLHCTACGWHGDRDYAASLNIGRLGLRYLLQRQQTGRGGLHSITHPTIKPVSYTGAGAVVPLPPPVSQDRPLTEGRIWIAGWTTSLALCSSYARSSIALLSLARTRKAVMALRSA
jgi:putative transposase